jgi:thymidylate kinase
MTHRVLAALFDALDRDGIRWTLQRVPSDIAAPTGDVDLLVADEHAAALRDVAEAQGFVALPGWSEAPNLILLRYDRPTDCWLVLDVATTIGFDRGRVELAATAPAVLARRRRTDGVTVPAADDAFWLLLLHCLLDKGAVPAHYAQRLRPVPDGSGSLATVVSAALGAEFARRLRLAAAAGEWDALAGDAERVRAALLAAEPPSDRLDRAAGRSARWVRRRLLIRRRRGLDVALMGSNGAGKSTLAAGLQARLPLPSALVYMGMWKPGQNGNAPGVGAALVRPMRVWARYAGALSRRLRGELVLFDRYVYDAHVPPEPPLVGLKRIYLRALTRTLPPPDLAIVLDVPPEVAHARKGENTLEELETERRVYRGLPGAAVVDASRPPAEVRADVTELIWQRLAARWRGGAA